MTVRRGALAVTAAWALAASHGLAQVELEVRLRADPQLQGPPALLWVRQQLSRFAPEVGDGLAGLRLQVTADGVRAHVDDAAPADAYLTGKMIADDGSALHVRCDDSGAETWHGARATFDRCRRVADLLACTDATRAAGSTVWIDVAVMVGHLGTGFATESPVGLLLTLGAAECGDLYLRVSAHGDLVTVQGRSRGGLTLPALLLALARSERPCTAEQRWIALAFAARDSRREEATMQLARFRSPDSDRCLRALLRADDFARVRAIETLARRHATGALPAMVAAADGDAEATAAAAAALLALWPRCSDDERDATRARTAGAPVLHAALARADATVRTAGAGGGMVPAAAPDRDATRTAVALCLALSALALAWRAARGRRQRIS